jgi:mono/diheme cytochrome c family protein
MMAVTSSLVSGPLAFAEGKTLKDGVYTEAQAKAGAMVYDSNCKTCHDMKFYENTLRSWNSQPLVYLWETIMGTMPADNPGSMMFEEYTDVLAYILSETGFPAGDTPLNPDDGMDAISIVRP